MRPKAIFIDWDGTLSGSRFWGHWNLNPSDQIKYQQIQQVLFQNRHDLLRDWMLGFISHVTVLEYISKTTEIAYDELLRELRHSCENMHFLDKGVLDAIQEIRKQNVKVVIATDNMDTFRHWTVPALKLHEHFDGIITSDTRGAMKANFHEDGTSMFFNHFFNLTGIKPQETILIDDGINNKVVENLGMTFLHVTKENALGQYLAKITAQT